MVGSKEGERMLRIGGGEGTGDTEREIARERDGGREGQRRKRDDRTCGTDVFETSCRSSHA